MRSLKSLAASVLFNHWNHPTKIELEYDSLPMPDDLEIFYEGPVSGTVVSSFPYTIRLYMVDDEILILQIISFSKFDIEEIEHNLLSIGLNVTVTYFLHVTHLHLMDITFTKFRGHISQLVKRILTGK